MWKVSQSQIRALPTRKWSNYDRCIVSVFPEGSRAVCILRKQAATNENKCETQSNEYQQRNFHSFRFPLPVPQTLLQAQKKDPRYVNINKFYLVRKKISLKKPVRHFHLYMSTGQELCSLLLMHEVAAIPHLSVGVTLFQDLKTLLVEERIHLA